jgi:hypothetical protein
MHGDELNSVTSRILLIVLGIFLIFNGVSNYLQTTKILRDDVVAPGMVTRLNAGGSHPQIQFRTKNGKIISYPQNGFIFNFHQGDIVKVIYNPRQPSNHPTLKSFSLLWGATISYFLFGALLVGYGISASINRHGIKLYFRGR